ncbi:hypothetical protein EDM80_03795 [bacterium]|nr:MAG: hypothetical protein EDM80_03795 [bacterium]MCE7929684.1 hypothetical protein [Chloroflexi bacterium CFX7]RIK65659.1 MAG: hypothetical protein DCC64_00655 [Planctomycetota bacterium]
MALSNEQRELLSAYLDDEVNASERALARALLERPEAAAYLTGLKRLQESARVHGAARAPADFSRLVRQSLDGDFDSISRPTSHKPASPLHVMPAANWRTPLMALAAAVIVAVGLFAYDLVSSPGRPQGPEGAVARETAMPAESAGKPEVPESLASPAAPQPTPPAAKKPTAPKESTGDPGTEDAKDIQDANEELGKEAGKRAEGDRSDKKKNETTRRARGSAPEGENWDRTKEGKDAGPGTGGGGGASAAGGKGEARQDGAYDDARPRDEAPAKNTGAERGGAPALGASQAEPVEVVVEDVSRAGRNAVLTELLAIGNLYGAADSTEEGSVVVELPEDQLEAMMAALQRLARDQELGSVSVAEKDGAQGSPEPRTAREPLKRLKEGASRAQDYLPTELKGALGDADHRDNRNGVPGESADGTKESEKQAPKPSASGNRVKVRITAK